MQLLLLLRIRDELRHFTCGGLRCRPVVLRAPRELARAPADRALRPAWHGRRRTCDSDGQVLSGTRGPARLERFIGGPRARLGAGQGPA